jgi:hypothetical protein
MSLGPGLAPAAIPSRRERQCYREERPMRRPMTAPTRTPESSMSHRVRVMHHAGVVPPPRGPCAWRRSPGPSPQQNARNKELTAAGQRLGVTLAELEDRFGGPVLAADLTMSVPVGSFEALVSVSDDLRRVRTSWRGLDGAPVQRRPARAVDDPGALALLAAERRRLQTHLSDLRRRLEDAMATGRSWSADEWARRMLGDPLRSALTHRMIWRVERDDASIPALLEANGLHDVHGDRVDIDAGAYLALWHPAQDPTLQLAWANRLAVLGVKQPIDQADREITLAQAPTISFGSRAPVPQMPMRGFLRQRGWEMPHLGRFHTVPEATRQVTPGGPVAVLLLVQQDDSEETVQVEALKFQSVDGRQLDATQLPPALVSESARDVLGALHAASLTHTRASPQSPAKHTA